MGSINIDSLLSKHHHQSQDGPTRWIQTSAMVAGKFDSDEIIFREEIPVEVAIIRRTIPCIKGLAKDRFELKCPKRDPDESLSEVEAGHSIIISQYPYNRNWFTHCQLKKPNHKRSITKQVEAHCAELKCESAIKYLENEIHTDHWESGDQLTAGTFSHKMYFYQTVYDELLFGICQSPQSFVDEMIRSERAHLLQSKARQNELDIRPPLSNEKRGDIRLSSKLKESIPDIMRTAIWQALAGPHGEQGRDWVGKKVIILAEIAFKRLLFEAYCNQPSRG